MRDKPDLMKKFHASDLDAVMAVLGPVPFGDLDLDEHYFKAVSLIRLRRDFADAVKHLDYAEKNGYSNTWVNYWRAHAYLGLSEPGKALEEVLLILSREPEFEPGQSLLVDLLKREDSPARSGLALADVAGRLADVFGKTAERAKRYREENRHAGLAGAQSPLYQSIQQVEQALLDLAASVPAQSYGEAPYRLATNHPVAIHSADHIVPKGTIQANPRSPRFVHACEQLFGQRLRHMDLGCSSGGLVYDFTLRGHRSVGLEGSDASFKQQRAYWRVIGDRLFTCDITKPFSVTEAGGEPARFDMITAWEVLEHIGEQDLAVLFDNISRHLAEDGLFVASVAQFPDHDLASGMVWHVTLKPKSWWRDRFEEHGLELLDDSPFAPADYLRGSGADGGWDVRVNPNMGFHAVVRRRRS